MLKDGPFKNHINENDANIIKAEYTTYTVKNGYVTKQTSIRKFTKGGDYHDSFFDEPLVEAK